MFEVCDISDCRVTHDIGLLALFRISTHSLGIEGTEGCACLRKCACTGAMHVSGKCVTLSIILEHLQSIGLSFLYILQFLGVGQLYQ